MDFLDKDCIVNKRNLLVAVKMACCFAALGFNNQVFAQSKSENCKPLSQWFSSDTGFARIVAYELGKEPEGITCQTDLDNIADLSTWNANDVKNINDIYHLRQLKRLALGGEKNNINDYTPIAGLKNLEVLIITKTSMNKLNFLEPLQNLSSLTLSYNALTEITLPPMRQLAVVDLSFNQVEQLPDFPVDAFPRLEKINLSYNKVKKIDHWQLLNNREVNLSYNNISTLKIPSNINEKFSADFSFNNIHTVSGDSRNIPAGSNINLNGNHIADLSPFMFFSGIASGAVKAFDQTITLPNGKVGQPTSFELKTADYGESPEHITISGGHYDGSTVVWDSSGRHQFSFSDSDSPDRVSSFSGIVHQQVN